MRILVTGGVGFIGSNFVHLLSHGSDDPPPACCPERGTQGGAAVEDPVQIMTIDKMTYAADARNLEGIPTGDVHELVQADICDAAAVDRAFAGFEPDVVVHFAAESHVDRSIADGEVFAQTNVVGTQVLLDAARRHDAERFIHVSTDEVYGSIDEGSFTEQDPYDPSSPYSASKAGADLLAFAHHRTYGLPVLVTRCTNNYGPRQHPEKLLPKVISRVMARETIPIYGDGRNVRDWLYVKDHCRAIELLLRQGQTGQAYNIAAGDERTNLEIVRAVLTRLGGSESLIRFVDDRPGHDRRYSLDDGRLRALGWSPTMTFDRGLDHTIDWLAARRRGTT